MLDLSDSFQTFVYLYARNIRQAMETYLINDVERLTGIKAHTLRIWEKRYLTLIPHRTPTKIRYYDDDQVRQLLNISSLLNSNFKIGYLMQLDDAQINHLIEELKSKDVSDKTSSVYINDLTGAMITFNEIEFDRLCNSIITRYGIYDAVVKIFYPFMENTGLLWSTDRLMPAQEHFASQILKRKLHAAIDHIPYPKENSKKFLLFLLPDKWHEIGLLFSNYIIRSEGSSTLYLGPSLPYKNLVTTISKTKPHFLLTFLFPIAGITDDFNKLVELAQMFPEIKFIICTSLSFNIPEAVNNIIVLNKPEELFAYL